MTPKLVLLTGPAAGEVAAVLRAGCPAADPRQGASCDPWWSEVRDYWDAPNVIAGLPDAVAIEHGIRSLPGGEEWLVGLVLPTPHPYINLTCGHTHWRCSLQWECQVCRGYYKLPTRLAILAPDAPPLLVERVRAWGGHCWFCASDVGEQACSIALGANEEEACESARAHGQTLPCEWEADTWPEAVRAALGEGL